ncbi:TetR family transcriptional regulator [Paenibacillus cellulosilyticus]|uniref:TetR family transcriptional regulator n=1 Tax=Paenibacillus cellulosilyticus TaxID=375489 RepID=A0A2V2YSX3_9BACL|nr:TetR/AcrR family transcriptional regulator [Paenibacillus cellulosilyticus]PWW02408.1 TetR family transcriptional regulator [Paenibacillus cellulosilyticus]QKS47120.1 TetR/AcrR family transcriptional regulator [Paenibacillus cellulosilyticus]
MPVNPDDPRVKRTRQLFMQAFNDLLDEKRNLYSISVQDIAARASVNRATFYAHFEDKFNFLEYWMTEKFQIIIRKRLPDDSAFSNDNLRTLVQTIFQFLVRFRQYLTPGDKQFEPMLEKAMQRELYRLLLHWFKLAPLQSLSQDKLEARALVVSWGIFGSALQWSRDAQVRSLESMAEDVIEVAAFNLNTLWEQSNS